MCNGLCRFCFILLRFILFYFISFYLDIYLDLDPDLFIFVYKFVFILIFFYDVYNNLKLESVGKVFFAEIMDRTCNLTYM